jgi:peptidoglycan L-alanyl-D-glutamate endopeptidase CwlK
MRRDLDSLHPDFQQIVRTWLMLCERHLYEVVIYSTLRTFEEQGALYAQGREPKARIDELRREAGMPALTKAEAERIVTRAKPGQSWHNYGLAIDFVPLKLNGKPDWGYSPKDPADIYDEAAQLARGVDGNVVWGAPWNDFGHLEWHPGLHITQAQVAYRKGEALEFGQTTQGG